jgi:hypothetical protein
MCARTFSRSLRGRTTALSIGDDDSSYLPIEKARPVNGEAQHQ